MVKPRGTLPTQPVEDNNENFDKMEFGNKFNIEIINSKKFENNINQLANKIK